MKHSCNNIFHRIKKKWLKKRLSRLDYLCFLDNEKKGLSKLPLNDSGKKRLIVLSTPKENLGGLCDKLRGIASAFSVAQQSAIDFKIAFNYPFRIEEYLEPNEYDWQLKESSINKDIKPLVLNSYIGCFEDKDNEEKQFQKKKLIEFVQQAPQAADIYIKTNAYCGNEDFHNIFHYLFKPSTRLKSLIEKYYDPSIRYISISFRFMELLGDFNDSGYAEKLDRETKTKYISDSILLVKKIYEREKNEIDKIFIATDSETFLNEAKKLSFVFTIPGEIKHTNSPADNFDKEFLDFYMISQAKHVYLGQKNKMWGSCFPFYAALIGNRPFDIIRY